MLSLVNINLNLSSCENTKFNCRKLFRGMLFAIDFIFKMLSKYFNNILRDIDSQITTDIFEKKKF